MRPCVRLRGGPQPPAACFGIDTNVPVDDSYRHLHINAEGAASHVAPAQAFWPIIQRNPGGASLWFWFRINLGLFLLLHRQLQEGQTARQRDSVAHGAEVLFCGSGGKGKDKAPTLHLGELRAGLSS